MANVALRKFTNPDTLKHIGDRYLIELLSPYQSFFAGRGLALPPQPSPDRGAPHPASGHLMTRSLPGPRSSADLRLQRIPLGSSQLPQVPSAEKDGVLDCEKLAGILMTPDTDMPRDLADALFLIHEMSTKEGMDKLQEAAEACQPPLDLRGADEPADVAVRVWLLQRSLLEELNAEHELARPKTFLSYLTDGNGVPQFTAPIDATRREWERRMDEWFEKKKRGSGCRVFIYPRDGECWFMVRHGEPYRREGSLEQGEPGSVFYRPQQHDVLIYDTAGGELRIHAGTQGERELYRKSFGLYVFGDENFLPGEGKYTLQPLISDGPAALNCLDVEGLEWVKLREVEFQWFGSGRGNTEREIRKANDLFASFAARDFKFKEGHNLRRAVFHVKFADAKRPRSVTISPTNRAKYERDEDGSFLEAWLKKRGFIMEPENDETDRTVDEP